MGRYALPTIAAVLLVLAGGIASASETNWVANAPVDRSGLVSADTGATLRIRPAPAPSTLEQTSYRLRLDDAAPLAADQGWAAAPNSAADADMEKVFRIRFEVAETTGSKFTGRLELQYRHNGGPWARVAVAPDDSHSHSVAQVEVWNSIQYSNADPTIDLLGDSALPFQSGFGLVSNVTPRITLVQAHTELEWAVKIRKFHDAGVNSAGDTFEFRLAESGGEPLGGYLGSPLITLRHPQGLIGGTHIENPQHTGPFADPNGNLYYLTEPTESTNVMMMLKSVDGGATWLEVDREHRPLTNDLESIDIRRVGDTLHIAHHPGGEAVYHSFRMSSSPSNPDSWDVRDEVIDSGFDELEQTIALEVLSDGRPTVFYSAFDGSTEAIRIKTRSAAGIWDATPRLLDTEAVPWTWATTVRADTGRNVDRIYVFYVENDFGRAYMRTVEPDGSLSGRTLLQTLGAGTSQRQPIVPPVYWNDAGDDKVFVTYKKADDFLHSVLVSGTTAGPEAQSSDRTAARNRGASRQPVADLVMHGDTAHLLYADAAGSRLWTDSTAPGANVWGVDTKIVDGGRFNWVRGNVFTHSAANGGSRVYGFAYEDHDTPEAGHGTGYIHYGEIPLQAAEPALTADAGPDQGVVDTDNDTFATVTLDGSASQPGDSPIVDYQWFTDSSLIDTGPGPTVTLGIGVHVIDLVVTDANGSTDTDPVTITVHPEAGTGIGLAFVSFSSTTAVPGVAGAVKDEDIVVLDRVSGAWEMYFDASDVGITSSDLDAFHVRADGSILMSFSSAGFAVPGLTDGPDGTTVDDSDVFLFTPSTTGEVTSGTFSFYLDGSDIGLSSNGEDIDGLYEFDDGSLGVSTIGSITVGGLAGGGDEDVYLFTGTFGAATVGSWSQYFGGSDVGLSAAGDDLDGVSFDDGVDLLFSTIRTNTTPGSANEDVNRFTGSYGADTAGAAALEFDLSSLGIDTSANVDGLHCR